MKKIVLGFLVLLTMSPAVWAGDDKDKEAKSQSPRQEFQALQKEYNEVQQAFYKAYREAKTDEERQKLYQEKYPNPSKYVPRFLELAEKNLTDPVALDALVWAVANARGSKEAAKAVDLLHQHFLTSEKLEQVCTSMVYSMAAGTENFLRDVLAKNPHKPVQGTACYSLALYLKRLGETINYLGQNPDSAARLEEYYGKEFADRAKTFDEKKTAEEVESLLVRATKEFADVSSFRGKLGEAAERELYEIRNLAIGKVAPEIEGEDIEKVKFKLSDYRGKVVVLDFWGNW